jgi:hypothetical protein
MFLLIRSFVDQLPNQIEVYLATLVKMALGEAEAEDSGKKDISPLWMRVLALEVLRG